MPQYSQQHYSGPETDHTAAASGQPPRGVKRFMAVAMTAVLTLATLLVPFAPALAQRRAQSLQLLSDAETEYVLRTLVKPIWTAAGIDPRAVRLFLVNDRSLNAFVMGGQNIFIHTGLLLEATAQEFVGVVAHETGHITGGHLVRGKDAMDSAMMASLIGLGLGVIGGVASGNAGAGMGGVLLGQQLAERSFLSFSRTQESAADQAGLSFLSRAGLSADGMLTFLQKLDAQNPVLGDRDTPYRLTHPMTPERVESVRQAIAASHAAGKQVPDKQREGYERVQAKLLAFIDPTRALTRYRPDNPSLTARYGRAYAYFRRGDINAALPLVDGLIRDEPKNAYFEELKGDLMLQTGRPADAVGPYRQAVALAPDPTPIRVSLAHALLETGLPKVADEVIRNLNQAQSDQGGSAFFWRLMAQAWALKGNDGMTSYAAAEEALASGDIPRARAMADRAMKILPTGSPGWLRAQDIRGQVPTQKEKEQERERR